MHQGPNRWNNSCTSVQLFLVNESVTLAISSCGFYLSFELQTCMSIHLLDISTFMTHKYLKLNITETHFIIFHHPTCPCSYLPLHFWYQHPPLSHSSWLYTPPFLIKLSNPLFILLIYIPLLTISTACTLVQTILIFLISYWKIIIVIF